MTWDRARAWLQRHAWKLAAALGAVALAIGAAVAWFSDRVPLGPSTNDDVDVDQDDGRNVTVNPDTGEPIEVDP